MRTKTRLLGIAFVLMFIFGPTRTHADIAVGFAFNPDNNILAGSSDEVDEIIQWSGSSVFNDSLTTLTVDVDFFFLDFDPFDQYVENFQIENVSIVSSWDLGLGDISDFSEQFDLYFDMFPEADFAWAWHTSVDSTPPSLALDTTIFDTLPRDLLPFDTDGDFVSAQFIASGSPSLGDGIFGIDFKGNVVPEPTSMVMLLPLAIGGLLRRRIR